MPVRARPEEPAQFAPRRVTKEDPRVQLASWSRLYQAPSYHRGAKEHAYALEVLAELLGGGTSSRLYRSLVVEQKLATSAGAGYDGDNLDLSTFGLYAAAQSGGGVERDRAGHGRRDRPPAQGRRDRGRGGACEDVAAGRER